MEEKPTDNPWFQFARDLFPYTCIKYGTEKVAILNNLIHDANVDPEIAAFFHDKFFPLTDEEVIIEQEMIHQNELTYKLLFPEQSRREEELVKQMIKNIMESKTN